MIATTTSVISYMNMVQIISISLGSAVLAVLLGKIIDIWIEKWRIKKEKENKLYKPIKFYLMLLENIDQNRNSLFEEMRKGTSEIKFENSNAKNNWQTETNQQLVDMGRPNVDEMLNYIGEIKHLFESNPELIKDEDWDVIRKFFDGDLKRKMLIAGGHPQKFLHLSEKAYKEWPTAIFEAVKELRKRIT
jgi:hypothetical protein